MNNVNLRSKKVKCRTMHFCGWCGERIEKGETAHFRTGKHDGEFFSEHTHLECWIALGKSGDFGGNYEYMLGDQLRGKTYEESHNE